MRVMATATEAFVARGDDTYPIVCQLHPWDHHDTTVACFPVIVAYERTLASGAFALSYAGHSEANALGLVKWGRI